MRGSKWSERRWRGRVGEAKGHRVGLGRVGKCWSVTGEIDDDSWTGVRANVERKRDEERNRVRVEGAV